MTVEEYLGYLKQNAARLVTYGPSGREVPKARHRKDNHIPDVYNEANVVKLLGTFRGRANEIRFVIDPQGKPLVGSMGWVADNTPGHEEMSDGLCLSAGVITFKIDEDSVPN